MEAVRSSSSSEEDGIVVWNFGGMRCGGFSNELRARMGWSWLLNDYIYTKSQFQELS